MLPAKPFQWNEEKNAKLKQERGISFEEVELAIGEEQILANVRNPNKKYTHQEIYVVEIRGYAYVVPYVQDETKIFLKTIIPSRKATKRYLLHDQEDYEIL